MVVVANMFIIRGIDLDDAKGKQENFKTSKNIAQEAEKLGWYNPKKDKVFDFVKTFSSGEYGHPYYS